MQKEHQDHPRNLAVMDNGSHLLLKSQVKSVETDVVKVFPEHNHSPRSRIKCSAEKVESCCKANPDAKWS